MKEKKPAGTGQRIATHSEKPRAIKFEKKIDKDITLFCITHEIRPSTLVQAAVECFLKHPECEARKKLIKGSF